MVRSGVHTTQRAEVGSNGRFQSVECPDVGTERAFELTILPVILPSNFVRVEWIQID